MIIKRISNNEEIDIEKLSINELYRLHFEEECYASKKLLEYNPFSNERKQLLSSSYEVIDKIRWQRQKLEYENNPKLVYKESKDKKYEFNLIKKILKKIKKDNIKLVELGCGNCVLLNKLKSLSNLDLYGIDIRKCESIKDIKIINKSIEEALKSFKDNSIDLLIADNVCEHFFKDESSYTYDLIYKKLNKNGKIVFIIPNKYVGPSDISKKFLKPGSKPLGFHYMEQTYKENIKLFNKHGLYTDYIDLRIKYNSISIKNFYILDKIKIIFEYILGNIPMPIKLKRILFDHLGYRTYILKKR